MPSAGGFERLQQMKSLTKSFVVRLSLLVLPLSLSAVEVDGVVATVGTESILRSDVIGEMRRAGADDSQFVEVRNRLIERKLILKAAREQKMTMQDWVVENRIREIIDKTFGGDRNRLMEMLAKQKVAYPEWHARMKDDMVVAAMRWNVVDKNVTARPGDMLREFNEHPDRYALDGKTTVSVILLPPDAAASREDVSAALRTNDFAAVARKYSVDSRASEGGVWKDVNPKEIFKPEICEEIAKMPTHTLSRWIELDGWSFLLRKDAETAGKSRTFEEAYDDVEAAVREAEARKAYHAWLERLKAETYIKVY